MTPPTIMVPKLIVSHFGFKKNNNSDGTRNPYCLFRERVMPSNQADIYWTTDFGVGTIRLTTIFLRSSSSPTYGPISFFHAELS